MVKNEEEVRVIVVKDPERFVVGMFGGVFSDGEGTMKVGELLLSPLEVPAAVAWTVAKSNDAMKEIAPNLAVREQLMKSYYNDLDLLDVRQAAMGIVVDSQRANPDIEISG